MTVAPPVSKTPSATPNTHLRMPRNTSLHLIYPKNGRLLLGTSTNLHRPLPPTSLHLSVLLHGLPPLPRPFFRRLHADHLRPFLLLFIRPAAHHPTWHYVGRSDAVYYDAPSVHRLTTRLRVHLDTPHAADQQIRLEVYSEACNSTHATDHPYLGFVHCSVRDVLSNNLLRKELPLHVPAAAAAPAAAPESGPSVVLAADIDAPVHPVRAVALAVSVSRRIKRAHRLFYVLSRQMHGGDFVAVYRSEVLAREHHTFLPMVRDTSQIPVDAVVRVELFQWRKKGHVLLGFVKTTALHLKTVDRGEQIAWWPLVDPDLQGIVGVGKALLIDSRVDSKRIEFDIRMVG